MSELLEGREVENLAQTLARELPKAQLIHTVRTEAEGLHVAHAAIPKSSTLQEIRVDLEQYLHNPRRTKATATFESAESFLQYVKRHADDRAVTWCHFDPQTFALSFVAVFDEHTANTAGWRLHKAQFTPAMSAEWKVWKGQDRKPQDQLAFAEWIQEHDDDIATKEGLPTSLQMLEMATNFVMNEERSLKSAVRLQSGGVRLNYIADPDAGTVETMQMFEKFQVGIPVFHGGPAWGITARLKYRQQSGKVSFLYELVRADRAHEKAALELIQEVRQGLGDVPLLMGSCA